jgi:hypothetical protein
MAFSVLRRCSLAVAALALDGAVAVLMATAVAGMVALRSLRFQLRGSRFKLSLERAALETLT